MEFSINKDDSLSKLSSSNSSSSSLPENLALLPLPPTETVPVDDAIILELSVPSLLLWIASESLIPSTSSDDESSSLHPKIGLRK
jgi:hypothetical protein